MAKVEKRDISRATAACSSILRKLGVGFIGAGQISKAHLAALSSVPKLYSDGVTAELEMLAEVSEELARNSAKRNGFKRWTADWKKVTTDSRVELVDVVAPTYLHKAPAIHAVEHGKHVLCEKPLATNSRDAEEMYRAARNAGVIHMVGFNYRRVPGVAFAKQLIERKMLGRIFHIRCRFFEDWAANARLPATWRFRADKAGAGALADLGSHAIDLTRHLFAEPVSVCAAGATFFRERASREGARGREKVDVDDTTVSLFKFEDGALGELEASWVATGSKVGLDFEVYGKKGSLRFTMERPNELQVYSEEDPEDLRGYKTVLMGAAHPYSRGLVLSAPSLGMGYEDSIVNQMYDLMGAIAQGGRQVTPSFYDGWRAQIVIDAVIESTKLGGWISVPK